MGKLGKKPLVCQLTKGKETINRRFIHYLGIEGAIVLHEMSREHEAYRKSGPNSVTANRKMLSR
jgi:hypothetical protein